MRSQPGLAVLEVALWVGFGSTEAFSRAFRTRFGIPIADTEVAKAPFYRPPDNSPEVTYLLERRKQLGGFVPRRITAFEPIKADSLHDAFAADVAAGVQAVAS